VKIKFLADACFNLKIAAGVLRRNQSIDFLTSATVNLTGMPDIDVMALAANERRIRVTHDTHTMPATFSKFLKSRSSAGVLMIEQDWLIGPAINGMVRIWEEETAEDWQNRITWLPL
jgi:predicted Zn-dependent protease